MVNDLAPAEMWAKFRYLSVKWYQKVFSSIVLFGLSQGLNLAAAVVIMRSVAVAEYGHYTLMMSVAALMMMLADLGYSSSIMAVIGERHHQADIINKSLSALMQMRRYTSCLAGGIGLILLMVLPQQQAFAGIQGIMVWGVLIVTMYCQGYYGLNQIYLTINSQSKVVQKVEILLGVIRLGSIAVSHYYGQLNIISLAIIYFATTLIGKLATDRYTNYEINPVADWHGELWKRLNKFTLPKIPLLIYTATCGQIMILLGAVSSNSEVLGEVGALSRLGQLFAIYNVVVGFIVAPNLAQCCAANLRWKIPASIILTLFISCVILLLSWVFPQAFLFILGSQYGHLILEMQLVVGAGCLVMVAVILGVIIEVRGWNRLDISWFIIATGIITQLLWMKLGVISTTGGLLVLNFILPSINILTAIVVIWINYRKLV